MREKVGDGGCDGDENQKTRKGGNGRQKTSDMQIKAG